MGLAKIIAWVRAEIAAAIAHYHQTHHSSTTDGAAKLAELRQTADDLHTEIAPPPEPAADAGGDKDKGAATTGAKAS